MLFFVNPIAVRFRLLFGFEADFEIINKCKTKQVVSKMLQAVLVDMFSPTQMCGSPECIDNHDSR